MTVVAAAKLKRQLTTTGWRIVDFVFPPQCPFCGVEPDREMSGVETICRSCLAALPPVTTNRCRRCSAPVGPHLDTSAGCIHCSGDVYPFERVYSLGVYRDWLQTAVLSAKHDGGGPGAAALARLLYEREESELSNLEIDVVVPIPHHWTERIMRRQLAPVTMSRVLASRLRVRWQCGALKKVRRTPKQSKLNPTDRRRNLRDAFRVPAGSKLTGRTILLVDDVLTTGTTARRATRALKQAGAGPVFVAAVARGVGDS